MKRLPDALAVNPRRNSTSGMPRAENIRFLAHAYDKPFVIVESSQNNINRQEGTFRNENTARDAIPALLNSAQGVTIRGEMENFLENLPGEFVDGQLKRAITAEAEDILEEMEDWLEKRRSVLESMVNSINDSLEEPRAGGATVRTIHMRRS
jgi:hypothetical protein